MYQAKSKTNLLQHQYPASSHVLWHPLESTGGSLQPPFHRVFKPVSFTGGRGEPIHGWARQVPGETGGPGAQSGMCKPPWGIQTQQRTCWAMGRRAWRNEALLARSLLPLTCWDMLGAERRATTAPGRTCRADGSWQESGCHGHAESPAGASAVCLCR